jgi:hypothetical protein
MPATKKRISSTATRPPPERRADGRLREQHLLGEDEVGAVVVRELEVRAHRDRVERAGDLAVAAEDAAAHIDLVDRRVALAAGHPVLRGVLGGHDADAVRGARSRAERAADALLEARVLELVELVPAAPTRVDRDLLLGVLDGARAFDDATERGLQTAQRLAEHAVRAAEPAGLGAALDLDDVASGIPGHECCLRLPT